MGGNRTYLHICALVLSVIVGGFVLSGCLWDPEKSEKPLRGDGQILSGIIAVPSQTRARCFFTPVDLNHFQIDCSTVVIDSSGNEVKATLPQEGATYLWSDPVQTEGAAAASVNCQINLGGLEQTCSISGADQKSTFLFKLSSVDTIAQKTYESTESVTLVSAKTFGVVPNLLGIQVQESGSSQTGLQNRPLSAPDVLFGEIKSICSYGSSVYLATNEAVFEVRDGRASLFAGSPREENINEFSHRLRLRLGGDSGGIDGLFLACNETGVYISDPAHSRIVLAKTSGEISRIAGIASGNRLRRLFPDGPALETKLAAPQYLAVDGGNLYFVEWESYDTSAILRRLDLVTGSLTTVVAADLLQNGLPVVTGAGGLVIRGSKALLSNFVRHVIFEIDLVTGTPSIFAGKDGVSGYAGDGGALLAARFSSPRGLAYDPVGHKIYVADLGNRRIRVIEERMPANTIASYVGRPNPSGLVTGQCLGLLTNDSTRDTLFFCSPTAVAIDGKQGLLFNDEDAGILYQTASTNNSVQRLAGTHPALRSAPLVQKSQEALLGVGVGIQMGADGSIYFLDRTYKGLFRIDPATQNIELVTDLKKVLPRAVWQQELTELILEPQRSFLVVFQRTLVRIKADGSTQTLLNLMAAGKPNGVIRGAAETSTGQIFYSDTYEGAVYQLNADGSITPLAGPAAIVGSQGIVADLSWAGGLATDGQGRLFVAASSTHKIWRIDLNSKSAVSIAGNGVAGTSLDDGWADESALNRPYGVRLHSDGSLFITELLGQRVKQLRPVSLPDGSVRYRIATLVGGRQSNIDCVGSVSAKIKDGNHDLRQSLEGLCRSKPVSVAVRDTCSEPGGNLTFVFSQAFSNAVRGLAGVAEPAGNIVSVERSCP